VGTFAAPNLGRFYSNHPSVLEKILEIVLLFLRFFLPARSRSCSADAPGLDQFTFLRRLSGIGTVSCFHALVQFHRVVVQTPVSLDYIPRTECAFSKKTADWSDTMPNLGLGELIVIFLLAVLVFGASRLPQLGEGVGKAIRNFKRGLASNDDIKVSSAEKKVGSKSSVVDDDSTKKES
jgi:sec-independent protein translocase protein TatA